MRNVLRPDESTPMVEMNTTPLIDVLLVLLVMFIITIPIQTHAVKLDLPTGPVLPHPHPVTNDLEITKTGLLVWNGSPMSDAELRQELRLTQQMDPIPELHLQPDPEARYEVVDQVLGIIKREHVQRVGFVGNERYLHM
jgi:biopolymer transport protein ExbD